MKKLDILVSLKTLDFYPEIIFLGFRGEQKSLSYKVHRLRIASSKFSEKLEQFLNDLEGTVIAIIPAFNSFGIMSGYLWIVEELIKAYK